MEPNKGKEAEVTLQFQLKDMNQDQRDTLQQVEDLLSKMGIGCDRGSDGCVRDLEFDWSLKGPVKVIFRRFTEDNKKNRYFYDKKRNGEEDGIK